MAGRAEVVTAEVMVEALEAVVDLGDESHTQDRMYHSTQPDR